MANQLHKRIAIASAAIMFFFTGCGTGSETDSVSNSDEIIEEQSNTDEVIADDPVPAQEVTWVAEPQFAFTGIKEFSPYVEYSPTGVRKELIGYPDEWEKNASSISMINYTGDAIEVIQGNKSGVFDYSGNELYPISVKKPVLQSWTDSNDAIIFTYLHYVLNSDSLLAFSDDFRNIGPYNASTEYSALVMEYLRYHDGTLQTYSVIDNAYSDGVYNVNSYGIAGEYYDNDTLIGHVILDDQGNCIARVQGDHTEEAWIVNKMLIVQQNGKYAFQSALTGELITDFIYDGAKEFMDGFAPVQKNGKWGFINSEGEEVTDFIFDDASRLYKGNTYVAVDGVYGVLNIADNLEAGRSINAETCKVNPAVIEEAIKQKDNMLIPIGKATVRVDNLNVRSAPSANSDLAAEKHSIQNGKAFEVYSIVTAEGYTWYQIDDNMWIASDGTWLEYIEYR